MSDYDAAEDGRRCYELAIAVKRENAIRMGLIDPRPGDEREARWAAEGSVPLSQLDTVREDAR